MLEFLSEISLLYSIEAKVETKMKISSTAFANNDAIPQEYTCDGSNKHPPLSWDNAPNGTKTFVLICEDYDAIPVAGHVFDHWVIYNIPETSKQISDVVNYREGKNTAGTIGYTGPCPPQGQTHQYTFTLYAIDTLLNLEQPTKEEINQKITGHILQKAVIIGHYTRR